MTVLAVLLVACGHVNASRYEKNGAYTVCTCEGNERQPTPSEADSIPDDERVDVVCEGKVTACHPGDLRDPLDPRKKQRSALD
ncbi:MAG: hypothetical protein KIT84_00040 [Labilithrix sp.]|nr:hypothetical protein [Labilithrix sp.]MCW5809371.1 hypothetical protein [Labilithrix sp.]